MAITIQQNASGWRPAYNDLPYVVSSNLVNTYYKFKYVCDVYATDGVTRIARLKTPPRADSVSGYAYFDIKRVLENYVTDDITTTSGLTASNSYYGYGVKFGEEYSLTAGGTANVASGFTAMQSGWVFGGAFEFRNFINFNIVDWQFDSTGLGGTGKWLTNSPVIKTVARDEREWLYGIRKPGQTTSVNITYSFYRAGENTPYDTRDIAWTTQKLIRIPAGLRSVEEYFNTTFPDAASVEIIAGLVITTLRRYNIDTPCGKYDRQRIHFLNRLGGYDSFTFNMKSELSSSITRKSYGQKLGALTGSSYGFDPRGRGMQVMDTQESRQYRFNSDWLTEEQMDWLNELISSPKIFLDNGSAGEGSLIPLNVDTNSFQFKKKQNDSVFQLEFMASLTVNETRQRY